MAETINLGIVGIKNMGAYDAEIEYEKLNVVTYEGSSYCALKNTIGNLPTDTDYWQLYAEKGDKGDTGDKGPQGIQGIQGVPGGRPLVANSVSDMTDTTSVYVNITDGHWYTYNGTQWIDGGVYQSTENQETIDARENFDGVSYSNLKQHLNTQFSRLYENYEKIEPLIQYNNIGLNINTGIIAAEHDYLLTSSNALFAKKGSSIKLTGGTFKLFIYGTAVGFYKQADINYISSTDYINEYVFTNDSYFRIQITKDLETSLWTENEINSEGELLLDNLEMNLYLYNKEQINNYDKIINPKFYVGNINVSDGSITWTNTNRLISEKIYINKNAIILNNSNKIQLIIGYYDKDNNLLRYESFSSKFIINVEQCDYIRIGVRTYSPDLNFINLTQEEINSLIETIKIYTYNKDYNNIIVENISNNFNGEDIINNKYIPNNLTIEKAIDIDAFTTINPTSFTHDNIYATQGFTSDKKRYLYLTIDNDDVNPCGLIKYDLIRDEIVKSIYATNYGHGNGMTYIEKLKELWITSFDYDNLTDLFRVSKVDSETLEFKENIDLQYTLETYFNGILSNVNGVGAITYNKIHDKVVYLLRNSTDINNTSVKGLVVCDTNNNVITHKLIYDTSFAGGLESDENYIYINRPNGHIDVYDWNLNYINRINYTITGESEGIVIMNKCVYTNANYQNVKLYKLNTSTFIFR